jgi:hypothetical protein
MIHRALWRGCEGSSSFLQYVVITSLRHYVITSLRHYSKFSQVHVQKDLISDLNRFFKEIRRAIE